MPAFKRSARQQYKNCLAYATGKANEDKALYVKLCSAYPDKLWLETDDFAAMMTKIFAHLKLKFKVAGTSDRTPTQNMPAISRRKLVGVGKDSDANLHFYIVTQSNGDGEGLCGTLDAEQHRVLPCFLRNGQLLQQSGPLVDGGNKGKAASQAYALLGFIDLS